MVWSVMAWFLAGAVAGELVRRRLVRQGHRRAEDGPAVARRRLWLPPLVAVAQACAGVGIAGAHGAQRVALVLLALALPVLVWLCAIDLDVMRLPDRFTGPLVACCAAGAVVGAVLVGDPPAAGRALLGGGASLVLHLVLAMASGGAGMGGGDVKLAPSLGIVLALVSWPHLVFGTLLAFLVGLVWGLARRLLLGERELPFGPSMVLGCALTLLAPVLAGLARLVA